MKNRILYALGALLLCGLLLTGCGELTGEDPSPTPPPTPGPDYRGRIQISELMVKNKATLASEDGSFPDWVELFNCGSGPLELEGFGLSDRAEKLRWHLPAVTLEEGGRAVVFCTEEQTGFQLKAGEALILTAPDGTVLDQLLCPDLPADCSYARDADGSFRETAWPSPWFENSPAGYECFSQLRAVAGLGIGEAAVANDSMPIGSGGDSCDWVEIRNYADTSLNLSGFSLSDSLKEKGRWSFPETELGPGECLLLRCDGDEAPSADNTGFSLDSAGDSLYLFGAEGELLDYVALRGIPAGGSMGRMEGEGGFFYFASPSPGGGNGEGFRRVSEAPAALSPDGCYDGVESLSVALSAPGEIHYTLDGSAPNLDSPLYTEELSFTGTCVLRAAAWEEGCLPSPVSSFSYFLNEGHVLPVLSLVTDDPRAFETMYYNQWKKPEPAGNLALYDGEHSFNHPCGIQMQGWTSLELPKKGMAVRFSGPYGGSLDCDVFGNGITTYDSLSLRAGQDYPFAMIRNELVQELCLEASDKLLTQASKYCVLYINGQYWGVYCLKEDFSRQYYAAHAGISKHDVEMVRFPFVGGTRLSDELIRDIWSLDLRDEEKYRQFCQLVDVDSFIDWMLFEGWCGNTDLQGNARVFRDLRQGPYYFALYDLDWSFWYGGTAFRILLKGDGNAGAQLPPMANAALRNPDFRERVLSRYAELIGSTLSNQHVLEKIDELAERIEPEMARDRERWSLPLNSYHSNLQGLKDFIADNNWDRESVNALCHYLHVSAQEREQYFGA